MDGLAESLRSSPELFPYALDVRNDVLSFVRLRQADYASASFLDARLLALRTISSTIAWRQAAASIQAANLSERCGFIFHIGHVGSTLLSRLIGAHPGILSLREPTLLRTFAQIRMEPATWAPAWSSADFEGRLTACLKLFSRTYDKNQAAIVKATSYVSELAAELVARASAPKAVMMWVSAESYLATIFGGSNSRQEAKVLTPGRVQRLHRRIGRHVWRADSLSEGETLALGWACEMSGLAQAASERTLRIDFDRFLLDPRPPLLAALRHFSVDAASSEIEAILAGPDMSRYSKAPEHAYDSALRSEVLDSARAIHGAEIRKGLAWLDRAAAEFAPVRDAMTFAETSMPSG
jgi:hypothetical protein